MDANEIIREIKKGLLKWYPFRTGTSCLYIGEETDAIFSMLSDIELQLTLCRPGELEAYFKQNGEKSADGERFDYIVAIASLEIIEKMEDAIWMLSKHLSTNGHLLMGFNNRLGARYFFGDQDPYTGNIMDGIEDYRRAYSKKEDAFAGRCYDKATLIEMMDNCGLSHQNYSVLPDLDNAQVILRDDYQSNEDFSIRILPTFHHADTVFLEEEYVYNSLQKNQMLHAMANALLFDCTNRISDRQGLSEKDEKNPLDILQVTSSMGRAREDAFFTIIRGTEESADTVEKLPAYKEGEEKLKQMLQIRANLTDRGISVVPMRIAETGTYKSLKMPYIEAPTAQAYLRELAETDEVAFLQKLDQFVGLIRRTSGEDKKYGYPDLVPLNCFYRDGEFIFFDQEFEISDYPADVAVFRSVNAMRVSVVKAKGNLTMEDLFERYEVQKNRIKWSDMEGEFIVKLRKEKELAPYFSKVRYDGNKVYSNRQRMNFSAEEYMERFVNIFKGLEDKKVIIFGSGQFAKQFMQMYGDDYDIDAVVDNRSELWGDAFYGCEIKSPEVIRDYKDGEYRVIICIKNFLSVKNQIEEMGVTDYGIFDPNQRYIRERRSAAVGETMNRSVTKGMEDAGQETERKPKKYHIGYIAGVFDLFHVGHLEKFKLAKEQCDYLIVGLVTDEGVRRFKKTEPFVPFEERKAMLEACKYVDEVVKIPPSFGGTKDAWRMYGFDVQFSGSDYVDNPRWQAEKEFLNQHGVDMVFFPYTESTSSSKLKELIQRKLL